MVCLKSKMRNGRMLLPIELWVPFSSQLLVAWVLEQRSLAGPDYAALTFAFINVRLDFSPKQLGLPGIWIGFFYSRNPFIQVISDTMDFGNLGNFSFFKSWPNHTVWFSLSFQNGLTASHGLA